MGWDSCSAWRTKSDVVAAQADPLRMRAKVGAARVLAKAGKGGVLWLAWEIADEDKPVRRFIECNLIERDGMGHAVKSMSAEMHPYYYDCPLALLDLVPVECAEWREGVKAYHAAQAQAKVQTLKLAVGVKVKIKPGCTFLGQPLHEVEITSVRPLRGRAFGVETKLSKRLIVEVL